MRVTVNRATRIGSLIGYVLDELRALRIVSFEGGQIRRTPNGVQLIVGEKAGTARRQDIPPFMFFRGEWNPEASYDFGDTVVIFEGMNRGTYVAIGPVTPEMSNNEPVPLTSPYHGEKWVQLPAPAIESIVT